MKGGSRIYGIAVVLILWSVLSIFTHSDAIPSPWETFANCLKQFSTQRIHLHLAYSLMRLLAAVGTSLLTGLAAGLFMGLNPQIDKLAAPVLYVLFPIPKVALLPILFIFFGLSETTKILLIFLIIVFQIALMIRDTIKGIPVGIFLSAKSMGLKGVKLLRHVLLPSISKTIVSALRISVGTGIAVLFFAENYATTHGIGFLIMNSWSLINYLDMYSGIVFLSLMGAGLFSTLDLLEKKYCRWTY